MAAPLRREKKMESVDVGVDANGPMGLVAFVVFCDVKSCVKTLYPW